VPPSELARRIARAVLNDDFAEIVAIAKSASPADRQAAIQWVDAELPGDSSHANARRLAQVAMSPPAWAGGWQSDMFEQPLPAEIVEAARIQGRPYLTALTRHFEKTGGEAWLVVRALARARLIDALDPDAYVRGLVGSVYWWDARPEPRLIERIRTDPDLLDEIWLIFERSSGGKLARYGTTWSDQIFELLNAGFVERERLLDATLAAQQRDFGERDVRVVAGMHARLEPTLAERTARLESYLRLISSPTPAASECGITHAAGVATPAQLAPFASEALPRATKARAIRMLKLLDAPDPLPLVAVCAGLSHDHRDVQARAVTILERRLSKLAAADDLREALREVRDAAAPSVQPRIDALLGRQAQTAEQPHRLGPMRARQGARPVAAGAVHPPFEPITGVRELVDVFSILLEEEGNGHDMERALDGVSRLCCERSAGFERTTSALRRRLLTKRASGQTLHPHIVMLLLAWLHGRSPSALPYPMDTPVGLGSETIRDSRPRSTLDAVTGLLARRAHAVATRVARGEARALAATPTLASGHLEGDTGKAADSADDEQATLRRPGHPPLEIAFSYVGQEHEPFYTWARWRRPPIYIIATTAPGEHPPAIAASLENTNYVRHREAWLWEERQPSLSPLGRLAVLWAITAIPHHLDLMLADAASVGARALEQPDTRSLDTILHRACDADIPLRDAAWHAIAVALLSKAPTLPLAACDLLVAASHGKRLDPRGLGRAIAFYANNEIGKLTRITAPITAWSQTSDACAFHAYETLVAFAATLEKPHRALHAPLTLAAELRIRLHAPPPNAADSTAISRLTENAASGSGLSRATRDLVRKPATAYR
jgi:hypothetical protein